MIKSSQRAIPAAFGGIGLSVFLSLALPHAALAACPRWDGSGRIGLVQTNNVTPSVDLAQTDTGLHGTAEWARLVDGGFLNGQDAQFANGTVDATIDGDTIDMTIYWDNQTTGVYTGRINAQGRITGSTYDAQHPQTIANWHSDRPLKCLPIPAPAPPPRPALVLGRTPPPAGTIPGPPMTVCERARAAAARNSPTAAALARECVATAGH
jgi:hypothetical protein